MYFPESQLANKYIHPLVDAGFKGCELGGSFQNRWGDKIMAVTINVDYTDDMTTVYKLAEIELCGQALPVDVVAYADNLPFDDSSMGFLLNSHVFEHVANPIATLLEWHRVVKPGGIIFTHIPKRDAHPPDREREISTLDQLVHCFGMGYTIDTHPTDNGCACPGGHYYVWSVPLYLSMIAWINQIKDYFTIEAVLETDDKVGNSHAFVLRVVK